MGDPQDYAQVSPRPGLLGAQMQDMLTPPASVLCSASPAPSADLWAQGSEAEEAPGPHGNTSSCYAILDVPQITAPRDVSLAEARPPPRVVVSNNNTRLF